ncbi:MAG: SAM-dependent methyltransferase, partial [Candidatus Solibacter usitatus]|nr:SAM-dependent methyltransferase [Candidatus Solibacter usitatus]
YHLTERSDRLTALREAWRALKPGGPVFAACITHWASLLDALLRRRLNDPEFLPIIRRDLADGQHRNPTSRLDCFTTAFFHRPEELRAEAEQAGFEVDSLLAVEGPGILASNYEDEFLREALRAVEAEPSLLGLSPHLLLVGRPV